MSKWPTESEYIGNILYKGDMRAQGQGLGIRLPISAPIPTA